MKNAQYFRHDASAHANKKLTLLMMTEGARGYGVYWFILELLRQQDNYRLPLTFFRVLPKLCHTHRMVVERVVRDYDLFVVDESGFYSPGMNKRMQPFEAKIFKTSENTPGVCPCNSLEINKSDLLSARIAEKSIEENNNSSIAASVCELPPVPIRPWQTLVGEMVADRSWMELVGMRSGLGQLYMGHCDEVVELFRQHIRLYDKGGGLLRLQDVKQYFANYLAPGSRTCQGVRERLLDDLRRQQADAGVSPYETIVDGQRTYLGRPIPDDAPPRPDEFSVWDEEKKKWTR